MLQCTISPRVSPLRNRGLFMLLALKIICRARAAATSTAVISYTNRWEKKHMYQLLY